MVLSGKYPYFPIKLIFNTNKYISSDLTQVYLFLYVNKSLINRCFLRVRDLSSGDNNAAAPPNTPPPRKYKLAEFRYGREEMLALLSDNYDFPLGLKEFEDIINKRPVQPLAFVPVSEEEEVILVCLLL